MTIVEFLEARIAEDEHELDREFPKWAKDDFAYGGTDDYHQFTIGYGRALAECAAKRAIIAAHPIVDDVVEVSTRIKWGFACETCFSYGDVVEDNGYCDTLRALAAIYKDHPDYDSDWAL